MKNYSNFHFSFTHPHSLILPTGEWREWIEEMKSVPKRKLHFSWFSTRTKNSIFFFTGKIKCFLRWEKINF